MKEKQLTSSELEVIRQHFEFKRFIGKGAFGKVIQVYDPELQEDIAVKKSQQQQDFNTLISEAQILKTIKHPNIVQYKGFVATEQYFLLKMELVEGGSLRQCIKNRCLQHKKFSDEEAAMIMRSLFNAINYLHQNDIVHRDLKPDNILLHDSNNLESLKVADLGLAVKFHSESNFKILTAQKGTLIYMAPEQVNKGQVYSKSVDIFSCGLILYQIITGKHPLHLPEDDVDSYIQKLQQPVWKFPSYFPKLAQELFLRLVKLDPAERYSAKMTLSHP